MKKLALALLMIMIATISCSLPKLKKVDPPADPTATAVPTATEEVKIPTMPIPTNTPDLQPPVAADPIFSEEFTTDDGSWNLGAWPDNAGEDEISAGQYIMKVYKSSYMVWSAAFDVGTSDVVMEVDARRQSGPEENGQGFICRYNDSDNFYYLYIGNDGWYSIDKYEDDNHENLASDWAPEGVIDLYNNKLTAYCHGNELTLLANGFELATVMDDAHSMGKVGLYARTYDEANVEIAFDNFRVFDAGSYFGGSSVLGPDDPTFETEAIFSDDFEEDYGNWVLGDFENDKAEIEYGWMTISIKKDYWVIWDVTDQLDLENVAVEAFFANENDITSNQQGFVCRYQDDDNYYIISFGNNGYLRFGARKNGEWNYFIDEYSSDNLINADFNFAQATCIGNELSLYIDGELVAQAYDPDNSFLSGDVGFITGTFEEPNVVISLDDFAVYALD